jgi:hypothetical protein
VQGIIIALYMQTYYFKTQGDRGNCTGLVALPWSAKEFLVVFCGATAGTEAAYAFGINEVPDVDVVAKAIIKFFS